MRGLLLATGLGLATLWTLSGGPVSAQQQSPDRSAQGSGEGQPQKDADKTHASKDPAPHSTAADNPFPEAQSQAAAAEASGDNQSNPPPAQTDSKSPHSTAQDNPFPEDVSRKAAQAAGDDSEGSSSKLPPGVSSSQSSSQSVGSATVTDPPRAKKDAQVGALYLAQGNPQGAYLRYQDAMKYDPTNIDAIFGAAEAARELKKYPEAARNYQLYLEISPNGPKSKKALKDLSALPGEK